MRHILIVLAALVFMGSLWQMEIAVININNGWVFGYFFCLVKLSNWAALDFFRFLMMLMFFGVCALAS